jgi:O-antigen/teichoic acid export membrane protein
MLFATGLYLARTLGVGLFGLLAFAQALLTYLLLVGDWGLGIYGTREIATRTPAWRKIWLRVTAVRTTLAGASCLVTLVIVLASSWDSTTKAVVGVTLLSAVPLSAMPDWVFRGLEKMGVAGALTAVQPTMAFAGILLTVHTPADVAGVPGVRLAAVCVIAAVSHLMLRIMLRTSSQADPADGTTRHVQPIEIVRLLQSGTVLLLTNAAVLAYTNIDLVLLRWLSGDQLVGLYSAAYRVIQLPMGAFYALTAAAQPVLTRQSRHGASVVNATVRPIAASAAIAGVAVAVVIAAFRHGVIQLLYGPSFAPAAGPLAILAVAIPLDFLVAIKGTSYVARGLERPTLVCVAASAIINIAGNLLLIPRFGMTGAALSTVISYAVLLVAYVVVLDGAGARG